MDGIEAQRPGIQQWGVLGYCWGGKVANLASTEGTKFKTGASVHPAMVDASDAEKIVIPFALLASKDEAKEDVEKWSKAIKTKTHVQTWSDQIHGFAAARSDLSDPKVEAAYKEAYEVLLKWYNDTL